MNKLIGTLKDELILINLRQANLEGRIAGSNKPEDFPKLCEYRNEMSALQQADRAYRTSLVKLLKKEVNL